MRGDDVQLRSGSVAFPRIEVLARLARYAAVGAEARRAERTAVERKSVVDMVQLVWRGQVVVGDADAVSRVSRMSRVVRVVGWSSARVRPAHFVILPAASSVQSWQLPFETKQTLPRAYRRSDKHSEEQQSAFGTAAKSEPDTSIHQTCMLEPICRHVAWMVAAFVALSIPLVHARWPLSAVGPSQHAQVDCKFASPRAR